MQIEKLPGIDPRHAWRLREVGIRTCQKLLQVARHPDRMSGLAQSLRLPIADLRELVDRALLSQLQGIGPTNLAHLSAAGVPTLSALAAQEADVLRFRLSQISGRPPNLAVAENWIAQARKRQPCQLGQEGPPAPEPSAR